MLVVIVGFEIFVDFHGAAADADFMRELTEITLSNDVLENLKYQREETLLKEFNVFTL